MFTLNKNQFFALTHLEHCFGNKFNEFNPYNQFEKTKEFNIVFEEVLKNGLVKFIIQSGGYKEIESIDGNKIVKSRFWDKSLPSLVYSLFVQNYIDKKYKTDKIDQKLTIADELFLISMFRNLDYCNILINKSSMIDLDKYPLFYLCNIDNKDIFNSTLVKNSKNYTFDFSKYFKDNNDVILCSLCRLMCNVYSNAQSLLAGIQDWEVMKCICSIIKSMIDQFVKEIEKCERYDLAYFIICALNNIISNNEIKCADFFYKNLITNKPAKISEQLEVKNLSTCLLSVVEKFEKWNDMFQTIGFFDPKYKISQYWKKIYEKNNIEKVAKLNKQIKEELKVI